MAAIVVSGILMVAGGFGLRLQVDQYRENGSIHTIGWFVLAAAMVFGGATLLLIQLMWPSDRPTAIATW